MMSMSRGRSIGRFLAVCWVVVFVGAVSGQVGAAASRGPEAYVHSRVLDAVRETPMYRRVFSSILPATGAATVPP